VRNKKSILLFLPVRDFNEEEYLTVKNYLQKEGINLFITSATDLFCKGNNQLKVKNDVALYNINENNFAGIILIGGSGMADYFDNKELHKIITRFHSKKKFIAAICIAPLLPGRAGLLVNKNVTSHYSIKPEMLFTGCNFKDAPVVIDKNIITASGPESAFDFSAAIINYMKKNNI